MCIILFAYKTHPKYEIVLAANRDEYYARPTSHTAFWDDAPNILAGRDLVGGGTWLGVTRNGKFAAVTNFRDASSIRKDAPSRGNLVSDYLHSSDTPKDYLTRISAHSADHNGFNLIVGDSNELYYHSNKDEGVRSIAPGIYGLSNHLLDTPWPKVTKGKEALSAIIQEGGEVMPDTIFDILADDRLADDAQLPQTGISKEYERALSSIFIATPEYGTRSSTVLLIDIDGRVTFVERTFTAGERGADSVFRFELIR